MGATKSRKVTRKDSTVRRNPWIRACVLALTAAQPVAFTLVNSRAAVAAEDSIERLVSTVADKNTPEEDRADAAARMVKSDLPTAHAAVRLCLQNFGTPLAQSAVARAISQNANPDPTLIPLLSELLGSSRALTAAAAPALANYRGNPEAFDRLTRFIDIPQTPNAIRADAIYAMGALIDRAAAEYLINLLNVPNQNNAIQNAAVLALAEMTGINSFGTDVRQWQQWWSGVSAKNQDQFQAMLLETRAGQFNRAKQRDRELYDSATVLLGKYYYDSPDEKKSSVALKYLSASSADVRIIGVRLIAINSGIYPPDASVRKKLLAMISDADDSARAEVVTLMLTLNNPSALQPLIDQLAIEKELQIKKTIAQALANLKDPAAAIALLKLLHDPQTDARTAAAKALSSNLGNALRTNDPAKADDASQQIRDQLQAIGHQPGSDEFRAACLFALAALRDRRSTETFSEYLRPSQSNEVRRAALQGLGNLGDTNAADLVASQLRDNNDRTVRLEAAKALQSVAIPQQADQIFNYMNSDPDPQVRDALWIAFQNLYPKESPEDLEHWQSQFNNDPEKKLLTLQKLGAALQAKGDKEQVASNQQRLADALMAVDPKRPQEAIENLQAALEYWRGPGNGNSVMMQTLVEQLLDAQLLDGRYTEAVTFASRQMEIDPSYRGAISLKIVNKADELLTAGNLTGAQTLISESQKMSPAIDQRYAARLQNIQTDVKQKLGTAPTP